MAKTDTDLQELKTYLGEQFGQVNKRLDDIEVKVKNLEDELKEELNQVRLSQAEIKGTLEAWKPSINKVSDLAEKVGELKNWRQIALVVITGTFGSLFGWFLRGGNN